MCLPFPPPASFGDISLQRPVANRSSGPLTCVATVATSLKTEFSTSASFGSGTVSPEFWDVSGRMRLQASNNASAGSVPLFLLTRRIVVFGSMMSLSESVWRETGKQESAHSAFISGYHKRHGAVEPGRYGNLLFTQECDVTTCSARPLIG